MADNGIDDGMYVAWAAPQCPNPVLPPTAVVSGGMADPTLMMHNLPSMDTWFLQPPEPVLPRPPSPMMYLAAPLDQSLYLIPDLDSWFCQSPGPVRRIPRAIQSSTVNPKSDHESIIPSMSAWFLQPPEPVSPRPQPVEPWPCEVIERTLLETPGMDTWFVQQPEPVRQPPKVIGTEISPPPEWRQLTLPTGALSWYTQQPGPIFPQAVPTYTDIAQPPAITPDDAVLPDTDTEHFVRTGEAEATYPRVIDTDLVEE